MKLRIFIALLLVAGAWLVGRHYYGRGGQTDSGTHALAEVRAGVQEVNESYTLAPGARVEVSGINGPVEIITAEGDTAEVHAEARADDARSLENLKITVEQAGDRLIVRGQKKHTGGFWRWLFGRSGTVRHNVRLLVPRRVELRASSINGRVRIGELEGAVKVSGVNGDVEISRADGRADFSGVNGNISVSLASLAEGGVKVSGVNGQITLRLAPTVNADVDVSGLHGRVNVELSNMTVEDERRSKFQARVGAGGPPIRVSGVNGDVHLLNR